jgi:EAL domain-containing protein (putative c-di-GMP-specific phosphodiesterase class I)
MTAMLSEYKTDAPVAACDKCEVLPDPLPEDGTLYVSPVLASTSIKLSHSFSSAGYSFTEEHGVMSCRIPSQELLNILQRTRDSFSAAELESSRAIYLPSEQTPSMRDLIHMENLLSIYTRTDANWLVDILRGKRITSYYHPIRFARNPETIFGREALLRGLTAEGEIISPGQLFDIARNAGMLFFLDREARLSAVRNAAERRWREKLFINFNPTSIYSPDNCLKTTFQAIADTDLRPENIVFEIVESDYITDVDRMIDIINTYRSHGFSVALDDLGAGYSSLNLLHKLKPDIVKLDIELIRGVSRDKFKMAITRSILDLSNELGIASVAEGIETSEDLEWAQENGATYVQGYLFDKPSAA